MEMTTIVLFICIAIAILWRAFFGPGRGSSSADVESGWWGDGDGGGDGGGD
jgi:hypothetical protein